MTITTLFPFCPPPPSSTISFSFHFINVAFFSPELKIKRVLKKEREKIKEKIFLAPQEQEQKPRVDEETAADLLIISKKKMSYDLKFCS